MQKIDFKYQRWFLRTFCLLVIIIFAVFAQQGIAILTKTPRENLGFDLSAIFTIFVITHFYFRLTQNCKCFTGEGAYWIEDGIVLIKTRRNTYSLNDVKALYGTTISFWGYIKSGMLKIDFNHKTLTLVALSSKDIESFYDYELYKLFETVLEYNTELKKDDKLDFCYELKK